MVCKKSRGNLGFGLHSFLFLLWAGLLLVAPQPAQALSTPWQNSEGVAARLVSSQDVLGSDEATAWLGLEVVLEHGWHTYWRNGGETGRPPSIETAGSRNVQALEILYPAPRRMTLMGVDAIGYHDRVLFPLRVLRADVAQGMDLWASVDLLLCSTLCVPQRFDFTLTLPVGEAGAAVIAGAEAPLIEAARALVPAAVKLGEGAAKDLIKTVKITTKNVILSTNFDLFSNMVDFLVETPENNVFSRPLEDGHQLISTTNDPGVDLRKMQVKITVLMDKNAVEFTVPPAPAASLLPLWLAVLIALAGGFILNLMPCVLPVLSLKILSLAKRAGGPQAEIRRSFAASAAGIVFSFVLLALAVIGLKQAGAAVGWGVQFQEPLFLTFMIALLTFFAANLWDFFHITLPAALLERIDPHHHPRLAGDFATGMLATLLATPCSAPFLGTAVSFALAAGAGEILAVFTALGAGMALPYLAVALWPHFVAYMPKPGAWMERLKHVLGFGLAGTALWLLWVLSAQIGVEAAVAVGVFMLALLGVLQARHQGRRWARGVRLAGVFVLLFGGVLGVALAGAAGFRPSLLQEKPHDGVWEVFAESKIAPAVAAGKVVFVDVTADWCLTCKFNKRFILSQERVAHALFEDKDVVAMKADWTNPDATIDAFLKKHGVFGVPFNIVYGPAAPEGIALPEILTPTTVVNAIHKAKGNAER